MSIRDGKLYFAPDVLWSEVELSDDEKFRGQLCSRFHGFYFRPAQYLLEKGESDDFAARLLILSAFDAIARLWVDDPSSVAGRFKSTFNDFAPDVLGEKIAPQWAATVYENYRNGLVHEARIKSAARFDLNAATCVEEMNGICVVNPRCLLSIAEAALKGLVSETNVARFRANAVPLLQEDFEGE